jgi:hypothetical protein
MKPLTGNTVGFAQVKGILESAITTWTAAHGPPDLSQHGASFSWSSKQELLAAFGHRRQMIQPEVIGNGQGAQANLIIDLRTGFNGLRMPKDGPFVSDADIQTIQDWIDAGCPD